MARSNHGASPHPLQKAAVIVESARRKRFRFPIAPTTAAGIVLLAPAPPDTTLARTTLRGLRGRGGAPIGIGVGIGAATERRLGDLPLPPPAEILLALRGRREQVEFRQFGASVEAGTAIEAHPSAPDGRPSAPDGGG